MSEKRFIYGRAFAINSDDSWPCITDTEKDKDYLRMSDIANVLNEQQATITALKEENEQLRQVVEEYRKTNKHLCELCADASKNGYLPPLEDLQ